MYSRCSTCAMLSLWLLNCVYGQDVLIIGAGIAGIEAAVQLQSMGMDVEILEARNRTGGRLWTEVRKTANTEVVLDYGAMWIQGGAEDMSNPMTHLAKDFGLRFYTDGQDESVMYQGSKPISKDNQTLLQASVAAFIKAAEDEEYVDCGTADGQSQSLQQLVDEFAADNEDNVDDPAAAYNLLLNGLEADVVQEFAAPLRNLSGCFFNSDTGELGPGDFGWMGSTGYMKIVDGLVNEYGLNASIRLGQVVTSIDYSSATLAGNGGNVVVTARGPNGSNATYTAPYVLVTTPLGVLKAGDIRFSPALPKAKQDAIQRLGMGILDKVFLLFEDVFWDEDAFWLGRVVPNNQVGNWTMFVSPYMYTKQPMLVAFIAGDQAAKAEQEPDLKTTVQQVLAALNTMYPGQVPSIDKVPFYTRYFWGKDAFSKGSYSYVAVNSTGQERATLAAPVEVQGFGKRLFFAGEATHSGFPSTVHGALLSGQDAALMINGTAWSDGLTS